MYQELLKTTTNSSCVSAHFANKADSGSDNLISDPLIYPILMPNLTSTLLTINNQQIRSILRQKVTLYFKIKSVSPTKQGKSESDKEPKLHQ